MRAYTALAALTLIAATLFPSPANARKPTPPPPPIPLTPGTLIDHVRGISVAADGTVERFTGLLITPDVHIARLFHEGDPRPIQPDYALDAHGAVMLPGLVASHMPLMAQALAAITPPETAGHPMPPPRPEDRDLALGTLQTQLLARGITTVTDMGTTIEDWQTYRRAGDAGRLTIRIIGYAGGLANMVLIGGPGPTPWLYGDHLRLVGLYIDAGASPAPSPIQLKNMMSRAAMDHFQPAVRLAPARNAQTPPDRLDEVKKAIAELSETYHGERRWRVEAAPAQTSLPAPLAPLAEGAAAAQSGYAETRVGQIAPGLWADFVLLDGDPLTASPAPRPVQTWIAGHIVWRADRPKPEATRAAIPPPASEPMEKVSPR